GRCRGGEIGVALRPGAWGGEAPPGAHLPRPPSRYSAVRVPAHQSGEGSRREVGYGSGIPPRGPAAACCGKAPTTTTAIWDTSFQRRTQIVSTKTYVLRSRLVRQKPGLFFGEIAGGTHRLKP